MNDFPDFSDSNYQVEKELGHNRAGGRVTYLATDLRNQQQVVIKQFQFAKIGASWSVFSTYDREIQLLKELDHPGIPRYLDSFQTSDGFCMVQEYKPAESLATSRSYDPNEIRQIASAALEVLVYLQNRIPPIIHRDIKPENILVDEAGNVYLVDFGFARVGEGEVGVSSVVKGTLGFMPPEQLFNRQLTEASDLYGLGMTLICLLTGTKSDQIGDLVDISYRVSFKHLAPKLNTQWVNWLEKMVEPRSKDRFPNAVAALAAIPTAPIRPPEAHFSQTSLQFETSRTSKLLSQPIVITNPIPDTTLEGRWEIVPNVSDPEPTIYQWIAVTPETFATNQVTCQVGIDSSRLMAGKTYHRKLLLHTNTRDKTYSVNLQIHTAPSPGQVDLFPYGMLSLLCMVTLGIGWLIGWSVIVVGTLADSSTMSGLGAVFGAAIGLEIAAWIMRSSGWCNGATASTMAAVIIGVAVLIKAIAGDITNANPAIFGGALTGAVGSGVVGIILGAAVESLISRDSSKTLAIAVSLLAATFGVSLGLSFAIAFTNSLVLILLAFSGVSLVTLVLHLHLKRIRAILLQYKTERHLIKP
jgi:serine/threonine protein kinase